MIKIKTKFKIFFFLCIIAFFCGLMMTLLFDNIILEITGVFVCVVSPTGILLSAVAMNMYDYDENKEK